MKLSIITVTFNNEKNTKDYLSLKKALPEESEIVVVDNNSQDKTVEILKKDQSIKLIENRENLGFSKGNNIGAKNARGEYLLFINPDVIVLNDSINKLLAFASSRQDTGVIAPKIYQQSNIQENVCRLPTLLGAIKEYIFNQKHSYTQYAPKTDQPIEVECVYGAVMLIKKENFEKLDGFDERYFLYYEDIDLCKRVGKLGLKIIYYPGAEFKHQVGGSTVKGVDLPFGIRTLAWFIPLQSTGTLYYQIKSATIYHGYLVAFLIRLLIYIRTRVIK